MRFLVGMAFVGTLLLYTEQGYLHRGFTGLGEVLTATVAGGLVAALVTPPVTRRLGTQRWVVAVLLLAGAVQLGIGSLYTHEALLVAAFLLGICSQAAKICVDTLLQESVDDAFRGRVFSLYDTLVNVAAAVAAGAAALVVPDDGHSVAVLAGISGGYVVTAAVYGTFVRLRSPLEPPEPVVTG
jgi:MFS family permease